MRELNMAECQQAAGGLSIGGAGEMNTEAAVFTVAIGIAFVGFAALVYLFGEPQ